MEMVFMAPSPSGLFLQQGLEPGTQFFKTMVKRHPQRTTTQGMAGVQRHSIRSWGCRQGGSHDALRHPKQVVVLQHPPGALFNQRQALAVPIFSNGATQQGHRTFRVIHVYAHETAFGKIISGIWYACVKWQAMPKKS